jgi:hypothetical protein
MDEEQRIRRIFRKRFEDDVAAGEVIALKYNAKTGKSKIVKLTMDDVRRAERNILPE